MDVYTRCQGKEANTLEVDKKILDTIVTRNQALVHAVLDSVPCVPQLGEGIWHSVNAMIDERVARTIAHEFSPGQLAELANAENWPL